MSESFRLVAIRLKEAFVAQAALAVEFDVLSQHTERQAALLRQADRLHAEGLDSLAQNLRRHADIDVLEAARSELPAVIDPVPAPGLPALAQAPTSPTNGDASRPARSQGKQRGQ